jgi:dihydrofolate reductase
MKLIVACDPKGGIGYKNKLPWTNIQGDLPRFKELTTNKTVVMGRNTWESLPKKPLPNRVNCVVSSATIDGVDTVSDIKSLSTMHDAWIIGGARLIETCWQMIDEIHLTRTFTEYTCDTFINLVELERNFTCCVKVINSDHTYEIWKRI